MDRYCKVLVVDDELLVRQGIKHLFDWENEGFTIIGEAANGKEALELIADLKPHIVIMDIVMPVMDGEELARLIKENHPDVKIVVLSSFSEFEYVRSTFQSGAADYILKPKLDAGELLEILKKTAGSLPFLKEGTAKEDGDRFVHSLLDKLLSGYEVDEAKGRETLEAAFPHAYYVLLAAEQRQDSAASQLPAKDAGELLVAKLGVILSAASQPAVVRLLPAAAARVLILLNTDQQDPGGWAEIAKLLAEDCRSEGLLLDTAFSPVFQEIRQLYEMNTELIPALLEQRFFMPDSHVFIGSELVEANSPKPSAGERFDAETFAEEINSQQFFDAFDRLRTYVASMPGRTDTSMYEFKSFLGHSVFNIILALLRFHYEAEKLDNRKYDYFRSIHESRHIYEAAATLDLFLAEAEECVMERGRSAGGRALHNMLAYIQEHYAEPLNLTEVAQHFHFNPSYLSNYFATHNKEGFSEYVSRVRIEKACELLRSDDTPIADISSMVGYSDHSYFTKVFRKQMGVSPSRYRRQLTEGH